MVEKKIKPKDKPHYVNNRQFSEAVDAYAISVKETIEESLGELITERFANSKNKIKDAKDWANDNGVDLPQIPEYIGECLRKICIGLSMKSNFAGYTYREEMVSDAIYSSVKACANYDITKVTRTGQPNAFGYFTRCAYFSFLQRIAKEKKQTQIKERLIDSSDSSMFAHGDDQNSKNAVNTVRTRSQNFRIKK